MLFQYVGSKRLLANKIINEMPKHNCYVEVFAGAAHIFFKKPASEVEVINDINRELITFYHVVKNHPEEFIKQFQWVALSRLEFDRYLKEDVSQLTDIQRAARFFYTIRNGFGGKIDRPTYGYNINCKPRWDIAKTENLLKLAQTRLAKVNIECLPYDDILKRYDRENTLFYLDPPYHGTENFYGKNIFSEDDFTKLANILSNIKCETKKRGLKHLSFNLKYHYFN